MGRFATGCRPAPPDDRDRPIGALLGNVDAPSPFATAMDRRLARKVQINAKSCVGQAISQIVRLGYLNAGIDCPDLSASYAYRGALNVDGALGDWGTHIRSGLKSGIEIGFAAEIERPYNETKLLDPITFPQAHNAADRFGIRNYYRIYSVDDCKRAIAAKFGIVASTGVNTEMERWNGKLPLGPILKDIEGYHAIGFVTYNDGVWDYVNSWPGWGINLGIEGMGQGTEEFLDACTDKWAIDIRKPNEV